MAAGPGAATTIDFERLTPSANPASQMGMVDILATLERTIAERQGADPASSYVARLFAAGRPKIAQKVGEEAVETVIAALSGDEKALISESADLIFHLAVLLAEQGLRLDDVLNELGRREGVSGLAEKAARTAP